jgi:hypothetical protein
MFRPRTIIGGLALGLGFFVALMYGHPAGATTQPSHQPAPCCTTAPEWYVNPDETALKPTQEPLGLLFDGPSLIHHAVTPVTLASAPGDGSFGAFKFHGSMPLFKLETTAPYSTINKTPGGYWSSKIVSGAGSQSMPLASLADFVGKWNYTAATMVYSFGVGYANDTGNKALVYWISFGGHKYELKCPKPSPSPSASSPSPSVSPTPSVTPTHTLSPTPTATATQPPPTTEPAPTPTSAPTTDNPTPGVTDVAGIGGPGGNLPTTGYNTTGVVLVGTALILLGGALLGLLAWRRRVRFTA